MTRIVRLAALLAAAVTTLLGAPPQALAGSNDKEVEALIESIFATDVAAGKHADALAQLELGKQACEAKSACSAKVRAKLQIAIGTQLASLKKVNEAKAAFTAALKEDPTASLFNDASADVQKIWNEVRGGASASGGTPDTPKGPGQRKPKKTYPGGMRPTRGWRNPEAWFYFNEATQAEARRDWLDCVDYAQASLAVDNRVTTRYLAATCEERAGLWIEAASDYKTVVDTGPKLGLHDLGRSAASKLDPLRNKIPKVILRPPPRAEGLVVTMNDVEVSADKLGGEIWVNPGQRSIKAKGKVDGIELEFEQTIDATEFETTTIDIKLGPKGVKGDQVMMKCMLAAKTRDDFAKCLNKSSGPSVNIHLGFEFSAYHDTQNVDVGTPAIFIGVESPTGGWGISGSFLVDVVTAASADIVATASPRFREVRYVPALSGHKRFGDADVSLRGSLSREPDYLATTVGAGFSIDLAKKMITPNLAYEFSYDISGRAGTPFSVFSRTITRHAATAGSSFVLNKSSILAVSFNAIIENGDTSKPYRYVPMFSDATAKQVPVGLSVDAVNENRLSIRPLEQLPTNRQRYALAALFAYRFSSSTLRLGERAYVDSWGLKASTTDAQYLFDVNDRVRLWPLLRLHAQTGADFWQLAYTAPQKGTAFKVPALRTGDRELGPLVGVTAGAGARFAFGERKNWALSLMGDFVYTRFLNHLFVLERYGYFGATTLEVDIE